MKRGSSVALALWLTLVQALSAGSATGDHEIRDILDRLRTTKPTENASVEGVIKLFERRRLRDTIPFRSEVLVTPTNWQTVYRTMPATNSHPLEELVISRTAPATNDYVLARGTNTLRCATVLAAAFAGSDFLAGDLGLEFLLWPDQRLLKKELRSGQSCYVIESRNPATNRLPYLRVVSWLDIDSVRDVGAPAVIHANAYDLNNRLLKEFAPKGLRKIAGQWQLEEMQMENHHTGTKTRIEFNLK